MKMLYSLKVNVRSLINRINILNNKINGLCSKEVTCNECNLHMFKCKNNVHKTRKGLHCHSMHQIKCDKCSHIKTRIN